ncbi:hypothetical protein GCM10022247_49470 [Allokutzneria multivorans]|uniref:Uncharacterized protein n=2 Tax=Allokutzneria multivorans TaxID=1142134 RepID=A0ABP7T2B4_9PSEU
MVVTGGVLAGCSVPGEAVDVPAPPAVRAVVVWSNSLCAKAKSVDELRGQANAAIEPAQAERYLDGITSSVDDLVADLKDVEPTRIASADGYVSGLVKALETIRPRLPASNDPAVSGLPEAQKVSKARQIAAVVAEIAPQVPLLASVAGGTPELDTAYDLAPGCDPVGPRAPARQSVVWADSMCATAKAVQGLPAAVPQVSADLLGSAELGMFISSGESRVKELSESVGKLAPIGVKAADEYRSRMQAALKDAAGKLPRDVGMRDFWSVPTDARKAEAGKVVEAYGLIRPTAAGLDLAVRTDAALGAAYDLAPRCTPAGASELPPARNGSDLGSCASGTCQVQVTGRAEVTIDGRLFVVTVRDGGVSVANGTAVTRMQSGSGSSSFGQTGGKTVRFRVLGLTATSTVLSISST